jgi:hypothetical protein
MSFDDTTRVIRPKSASNEPQSDTRLMTEMTKPKESHESVHEDDTRIFRPSSRSTVNQQDEAPKDDFHQDPVVGWLVIVAGPGRGISKNIGYGVNNIGRDPNQRISIDYGDEQISRSSHASVVYDPKSRKFFIQHGEGINLTYVNEVPVLKPIELIGREKIGIGNTEFIFVPFCGATFDWSD